MPVQVVIGGLGHHIPSRNQRGVPSARTVVTERPLDQGAQPSPRGAAYEAHEQDHREARPATMQAARSRRRPGPRPARINPALPPSRPEAWHAGPPE
jgi:hypothetical protein